MENRINVRLNQEDFDTITKICKLRGISRSDFAREGIFDLVRRSAVDVIDVDCLTKHHKLLEKLKKIGQSEQGTADNEGDSDNG